MGDRYFPQQHFNRMAQMTSYKSISNDSIAAIMPVLHSIISGILDIMFQQICPFLIKTDMEINANITKTLMEKISNAWSRINPNFHPI